MSKNWPDDDKPAAFWDLTEPVCAAIREAYELTPKDYGDKIEWTGLTMPEKLLATSFPFHERLTKENLTFEEEDQGRDPLDVLIAIAVQLGIEQERRCSLQERAIYFDMLDLATSGLKR